MTSPDRISTVLTRGPLTLGPVELRVADLERSVSFYTRLLGTTILTRGEGAVTLGLPGRPLLSLTERRAARPVSPVAPGLYHFAVLLPTRADLARWVRHAANLGVRVGQADHLVSEAFYLNDPDGHGIEMYRDRDPSEWPWQDGQVRMASDPIDLRGLLAERGADVPFGGLPDGTVMGHLHLRVTDLPATEAFYRGVLGFDVMARWPGALFVSVGGYHHHFGLNTWQSEGGAPASPDDRALLRVHVHLPDAADLDRLDARLRNANVPFGRGGRALDVEDPAGNALRFHAGQEA